MTELPIRHNTDLKCTYHKDGTISLHMNSSDLGVIWGLMKTTAARVDVRTAEYDRVPPLTLFLEEVFDYLYADYEGRGHVELAPLETVSFATLLTYPYCIKRHDRTELETNS